MGERACLQSLGALKEQLARTLCPGSAQAGHKRCCPPKPPIAFVVHGTVLRPCNEPVNVCELAVGGKSTSARAPKWEQQVLICGL